MWRYITGRSSGKACYVLNDTIDAVTTWEWAEKRMLLELILK
jgi:hypothetical protein